MRKMGILCLFFAFLSGPLVQTVQAGSLAQWYYWVKGDQLMLVQQQNLDMLESLRRQGRRSQIRSLAEDAVFDGNNHYWVRSNRPGYGYPVMDSRGRPMGRKEKIENLLVPAGMGAIIGGVADGRDGAIIGAAAGAGAGWLMNKIFAKRAYVSEAEQRIPAGLGGGSGISRDRPVMAERVTEGQDQFSGQPGPYFTQAQASDFPFKLKNSTGVFLDVFDGDRYVGRMRTGDTWHVAPPQIGYRAQALVPNTEGGLTPREVATQPLADGWTFIRSGGR